MRASAQRVGSTGGGAGILSVGLMSGTSADGIDAALIRIREADGRSGEESPMALLPGPYPPRLKVSLIRFCFFPFSRSLRERIFALSGGGTVSAKRRGGSLPDRIGELAYLDVVLGELFARSALRLLEKAEISPGEVCCIGSHGQTVFHAPKPRRIENVRVATTLQIGDGSVIAQRTGIPCVSDFRRADLAVGGEGAPLVPIVDWILFSHETKGRVLLNIGGISNLTCIPPEGRGIPLGSDVGPGNMLIDGIVKEISGGKRRCDTGGEMAGKGKVREEALAYLQSHPFVKRDPPKSTGREEFGEEFLLRFLKRFEDLPLRDLLATATRFTGWCVGDYFLRFLLPRRSLIQLGGIDEVLVSGGGIHNKTLMKAVQEEICIAVREHQRAGKESGTGRGKAEAEGRENLAAGEVSIGVPSVLAIDRTGISSDAKEAVAFAVLGYLTMKKIPGNLPSVTGARKPVVLGKVSYP